MKNKNSEQIVSYNGNGNGNGYSNGSNSNSELLYSLLPLIHQNNAEEQEESLDIRQLWTVVKHRLPLIATVALSFAATVGLWTITQPKVYQGKFQLLIEPAQNDTQESQISLLGSAVSTVDYATQIEVLRSPQVLKPIIERIATKYPDFEYGNLIKKKGSPLEISQLEETKILEITYENTDPAQIDFILDKLAQGYLQHSLDERQTEIRQGIEYVDEQLPGLRERVDGLQEKLQKFRQEHNLISPENEGQQLFQQLSTLESQYFDTQVALNETNSLYSLLQKQLGLQPEQALTSSYLSESPQYQNLLTQLQQVEIELAKESARFLDNTPTIAALKEQKENILGLLRQEAELVLGKNLSDELIKSPFYASPSALRLDLNKQYIQAANQLQVLKVREKALQEAINSHNEEIKLLPVIARQYTDLQRELGIATDSLNRFLAARETLQLQAAQQALPWQLISPPKLPEKPIYPQPLKNLALGTLGGLLLGLGAAFLAERLDPVFHSSEELKDSVQLPVLGLIPVQKELDSVQKVLELNLPKLQIGEQKVAVESATANPESEKKRDGYKSSPFLEAFRSLYTNIRLLGSDTPIKSIVISSSAPSEGKSTISLNLAKAAAAMGQRVLLIDADLRRPQVHHRLGLKNEQGLSNVIATGFDLDAAIQTVSPWENLSILTAGDIPPDPTRLLSSNRMQQVMEQLETSGKFDLIIYDTPPLLGFADARILASVTTGIVLVAKMGKTDRSALKQSVEQLKMSQVSILGVVANNVTRHSHGSYYYYDHYYRYYGRN